MTDRPASSIVIAGGSGFLGCHIARFLAGRGWNVTVLSRQTKLAIPDVKTFTWDGRSLGHWVRAIENTEVVLNLAGRSVNCRYNAGNRKEIEESRVQSTSILGLAIARASRKPRLWINSSTATIYRHAEDRPQDEFTGEIGSGFSVNVPQTWEKTFFDSDVPGIRKIALRSAMVMGRGQGGPLDVFWRLVRLGLGGRMGTGTQFVSWVHIDDFCRAIEFLVGRVDLDGILNVSAPNPIRNRNFMASLRKAAGMRIGLPASRWMLEIGAFVLRTETELPLKSRWVVPTRLLNAGFSFTHPNWASAAADLFDNHFAQGD